MFKKVSKMNLMRELEVIKKSSENYRTKNNTITEIKTLLVTAD